MFTTHDIDKITGKGLSLDLVQKQIDRFKSGFPFLDISEAATPEKGIRIIDKKDISKHIKTFEKKSKNKTMIKFVPASGAASRMFKNSFSFYETFKGSDQELAKLKSDKNFYSINNFIANIEKFAFYDDLKKHLQTDGFSIDKLIENKEYKKIVEYLLFKGLMYGNIPKGLILFHKYETASRTAIEEQLVEGAHYAKNSKGDVYIHFTVSPEFLENFKAHIDQIKKEYQVKYGVKYVISYSIQKPHTDTIAVDGSNQPFRNEDNSLLFRPGGHGALIENLNDLEYDIIFIKNIDNVAPDRLKPITYDYKKALAGILLHYQVQIFKYIEKLENTKRVTDRKIKKIKSFLEDELQFFFPSNFFELRKDQQSDYILEILNRPIRVCGMVKNEGEPGGGPFFVKEPDGAISLQIIEKAQVNTKDEIQNKLLETSTHFNPVDIVCGVSDLTGKKFNLLKFIDENSGIITQKSNSGKELKALELPGLWNGAMANWTTIFVEVPIETFTPVKELNDLLRTEHQELS
ncbi:MAG: DUF4301 family protein [Bacteroidales bacterium]|nr:DUF4301 family protein [Bacteroidales bacterium]